MKTSSSILEIATFRLKPGVTDGQFQAAIDGCTRFLLRCEGFRGRRLTRTETSGLWVELCEWSDARAARAAGEAFWEDEETAAFRACIDESASEMSVRHVRDHIRAAGRGGAAGLHANLVTARFDETWDFYTRVLGFSTAMECDGYVHLVHESGTELGVMRHELNGDWPELVNATDGRGWWLSVNVDDADLEHARLVEMGVEITESPTDRPWGERCFVLRDPNGVLVFVAHKLASRVEREPLAV